MYRKGKKKKKMRLDISKLLKWDAVGRGGGRGEVAVAI
jgi:hypothetical protein